MSSTLVYGSPAIGYVQPAVNQTLISRDWHYANNGATIYTVTAGKTLYIAGIYLYTTQLTGVNGWAELQVAGVTKIINYAGGGEVFPVLSNGLCPILKCNSNEALTVNCGPTANINHGTLWGWEQ